MNNLTEVMNTVENMAKNHGLLDKQIPVLQRYFLCKKSKLSINQIASFTNTSTFKVYDSIQRVESGKRYDEIKAKIFAVL